MGSLFPLTHLTIFLSMMICWIAGRFRPASIASKVYMAEKSSSTCCKAVKRPLGVEAGEDKKGVFNNREISVSVSHPSYSYLLQAGV